MQYVQLNQSFKALINVAGSAAGDAITYVVSTSTGTTFASGTPTFVVGTTWSVTFTPTTAGETYVLRVIDATVPLTVTEMYTSVGVIGAVWDAVSGATGSAVGVANIALSKIGAQRIVSMTEATENARLLNAIYGTIRDEVLRAHPWNFAIKRIAPALYAYTPPIWVTWTTYTVGQYVSISASAWVTTTVYAVNSFVTVGATTYRCLIAHTANVFATDLAAGKWVQVTGQYQCLIAHTSGTFSTDLVALKWGEATAPQVAYEYDCSHTIPADCLRVIDVTDGFTRIEDFKIEDG